MGKNILFIWPTLTYCEIYRGKDLRIGHFPVNPL
jgi:hypothetical protein